MRYGNRTSARQLASVAFFLAATLALGACGPAAKVGNAVGDRAPDFALADGQGRKVRLSDFAGKVVVLNFWATWCPPCRREIPDFVRLQAQYASKGVVVVGVSLDESWDPVLPFVSANAINYPVVLGDADVVNRYRVVDGIPTTFVIDGSGVIRKRQLGYGTAADFQRAVDEAL